LEEIFERGKNVGGFFTRNACHERLTFSSRENHAFSARLANIAASPFGLPNSDGRKSWKIAEKL
jgi:hypothetical protein